MSVIKRQAELLDVDGFDFSIAIGVNDKNIRVIMCSMREKRTQRWFPFMEMDLDNLNYWKDVTTGFDPNRP